MGCKTPKWLLRVCGMCEQCVECAGAGEYVSPPYLGGCKGPNSVGIVATVLVYNPTVISRCKHSRELVSGCWSWAVRELGHHCDVYVKIHSMTGATEHSNLTPFDTGPKQDLQAYHAITATIATWILCHHHCNIHFKSHSMTGATEHSNLTPFDTGPKQGLQAYHAIIAKLLQHEFCAITTATYNLRVIIWQEQLNRATWHPAMLLVVCNPNVADRTYKPIMPSLQPISSTGAAEHSKCICFDTRPAHLLRRKTYTFDLTQDLHIWFDARPTHLLWHRTYTFTSTQDLHICFWHKTYTFALTQDLHICFDTGPTHFIWRKTYTFALTQDLHICFDARPTHCFDTRPTHLLWRKTYTWHRTYNLMPSLQFQWWSHRQKLRWRTNDEATGRNWEPQAEIGMKNQGWSHRQKLRWRINDEATGRNCRKGWSHRQKEKKNQWWSQGRNCRKKNQWWSHRQYCRKKSSREKATRKRCKKKGGQAYT